MNVLAPHTPVPVSPLAASGGGAGPALPPGLVSPPAASGGLAGVAAPVPQCCCRLSHIGGGAGPPCHPGWCRLLRHPGAWRESLKAFPCGARKLLKAFPCIAPVKLLIEHDAGVPKDPQAAAITIIALKRLSNGVSIVMHQCTEPHTTDCALNFYQALASSRVSERCISVLFQATVCIPYLS